MDYQTNSPFYSKLPAINTIKKLLFVLTLLIIPSVSYCQDDSLNTVNEKIAEAHCNSGQGNGSLRLSLPQLETIITGKYNQKALLRILPKHICQYKLSFNGDEKTGQFDIPNFEFSYFYTDHNNNPNGIVLTITIEGSINSSIKYIKLYGISSLTYDEMLNYLNKNCLYRGSISTNYEKHYVNKARSLVIILCKNGHGDYSVEID